MAAKKNAEVIEKKMVKVTLVKSTIGRLENQILTVKALGLHKIGQSKTFEDNACLRGMIFKVSHLVKVEEI